ncbi:VUT family protein [Ralstonia pseudosolanacearum]
MEAGLQARDYKLYGLIVGLSVAIMIVCDALIYKTVDIHGLKITGSGIVFSLNFLLSTIATEVYGYRLGGRTVWVFVSCQTVFVILINVFSIIQPEGNELAKAYYFLFHDYWRVMLAVWAAVPAAYFCNGFIVSWLKIYFNGRLFIARYVLSAVISQGVMLLISYPINLYGKYSNADIVNIILTTWSYKVVMSVILLPLGLFLAFLIKRIEKTDYYDWGVPYNPFLVFGENDTAINRNRYDRSKSEQEYYRRTDNGSAPASGS